MKLTVNTIVHFLVHACLAKSWVPVCTGHTFSRDTGVVRGEAIREAPVPIHGRPVHGGLQVLPPGPLV